jgi:putative pyruvate formate lyase activating enzyme
LNIPDLNINFEELKDCSLCPRNCHANRFSDKLGWCKTGANFPVSSIVLHHGEEPPVSGEEGICNIFFTNCNLQCVFCQNHQISDNRVKRHHPGMSLDKIASTVTAILDKGISRVGFVSPSHVIPQVKAIIRAVESQGYKPAWVYNSNGYDKVETLKTLEGMIDVWLPDFKYSDPSLSAAYSDAIDYPEMAKAAIKEMVRQKGPVLHLSDHGTVESGIIIRHLVLPGHIENSLNVLRIIAEDISPRIHISLMSQYYPTHKVVCHPTLGRTVTRAEYDTISVEMARLGLLNGWVQELDSAEHYRPDFERPEPFSPHHRPFPHPGEGRVE